MNTNSDIEVRAQIYGKSSSALAARARERMEGAIAQGKDKAKNVIEKVLSTRIQDQIVPAKRILFHALEAQDKNPAGIYVSSSGVGDSMQSLHPHALHQLAERAHIPWTYVEHLRGQGPWGLDLLESNLQRLYGHDPNKYLFRSVNKQVRGFLSDRYRRRDTGVLIEAFAKACGDVEALPYEGYATDTKVSIQAIVAKSFEPIPNEVMAYGVNFEDSSFGNGPTQVSMFVLRGVCLNGMISTCAIRQIHIGKELTDDFQFEADTYEKDTEALALKIRDIVRGSLNPETVDAMQNAIRIAHNENLTERSASDILKKSLNKKEVETVLGKYNDEDEIILLPEGKTKWRLANAISWFAGKTDDGEKKIELQRLAGNLLKAA